MAQRVRAGALRAVPGATSVCGVTRRPITAVVVAVVVASGLVAVAAPGAVATPRQVAATLHVQGSVNQVAVTGATPGDGAELRDRHGGVVEQAPIDDLGSVLFRKVPAGKGYVVAVGSATSGPVTVTKPTDVPPQSFYSSQHLADGYGYLKTRDGTLLSVNCLLYTSDAADE